MPTSSQKFKADFIAQDISTTTKLASLQTFHASKIIFAIFIVQQLNHDQFF